MRSGTGSDFREAATHQHELNGRQREILRLIEKGHTNREIAEMLGISVDGAKWNVSEILSKLGLASREEAAEYWRWRHGGVWSRLRSVLAAPLAKVAGAGAAAVVAGAVALALLRDEPPDTPVPGSFYLEAHFTIESPLGGSRDIYAKYWWRDATHWRQEIEDRTPSPEAGKRIVVWNEGHQWEWDSRLNLTTTFNVDPSNADGALTHVPSWLPYLAFAPIRLEAPSVDEYLSRMNAQTGEVTFGARRAGVEDGLIGIEVRLTGPQEAAPKTIWVEPDRLFVLRAASALPASAPSSAEAIYEVTKLEHEPRLDDDLFEFVPPTGSVQREGQNIVSIYFPGPDGDGVPTPYHDAAGGVELRMEPPFLSLSSLPAQFVAWGERSVVGADEGGVAALATIFGVAKVDGLHETYDGPYLLVEQRRRVDGLPAVLRTGDRVDIDGNNGFLVEADGEVSVAWAAGEVAVRVSSDVLTAAEALEVARGMYLADR